MKDFSAKDLIKMGVDFAGMGQDKTVAVFMDELNHMTPVDYSELEARVLADERKENG